MSKRRRRQKQTPERRRRRLGRQAPGPGNVSMDELLKRFGTTDSLSGSTSDAGQEDLIGDAAGIVRQRQYAEIWKRRHASEHASDEEADLAMEGMQDMDLNEETSDEDERIAHAMEEHPEYHAFFDDPDLLNKDGCTKDGVNPFVHVSMHAIVEGQLAGGEPPQVADYLRRLQAAGLSRHDAVHEIARAVSEMIYHMLREETLYDEARYLARLEKLVGQVEKEAKPQR